MKIKELTGSQNKDEVSEDIVDFKAANGQLSAMGSKRQKTQKDTVKGEVEQLFRDIKK
jgi:hypothetical protein